MEKTVIFSEQRLKKMLAHDMWVEEEDVQAERGMKTLNPRELSWLPKDAEVAASGHTYTTIVCSRGMLEVRIGFQPKHLLSGTFNTEGELYEVGRENELFGVKGSFNDGSVLSRSAREIYFAH